jgi:MerC mercury resistance protein
MPQPIQHSHATTPSLDAVGATTSVVCAVHCAIVALFLGAAPAIPILAASWVDWAFLAVSAAVGLASLIPGYRLHRARRPLALFALGIALLLVLRLLHVRASLGEMAVVIVAASSLIAAHWINRGATTRCICGQQHD